MTAFPGFRPRPWVAVRRGRTGPILAVLVGRPVCGKYRYSSTDPHTGRTTLAHSPARPYAPCAARMTAAAAAGLAGCRPARSANHFLTSPPQPGAEVRKQLHRTAPTPGKERKPRSRSNRGGTLNPATEHPKAPRFKVPPHPLLTPAQESKATAVLTAQMTGESASAGAFSWAGKCKLMTVSEI